MSDVILLGRICESYKLFTMIFIKDKNKAIILFYFYINLHYHDINPRVIIDLSVQSIFVTLPLTLTSLLYIYHF
jgi:hypothetical protein